MAAKAISSFASSQSPTPSPLLGKTVKNRTTSTPLSCRTSRVALTKAKLAKPSKFTNGRLCTPMLKDSHSVADFLGTRLEQEMVSKPDIRLRIFSGSANPSLSQEIAHYMGLDLGKIKIKRFADGEIYVQFQESVRGCDVYLVQPTCPPANENLMELLIMIDACRRASARSITAVIPYFGYARADRKTQGRESISAKLVANMITGAGTGRVLACDLHSGQAMGYFDIPFDHVFGEPVILDYLASKMISSNDLVVVSPDVGGVARARGFAKKLSDAPLAIVDKRRQGHNVSEVMNLIGDVKGKVAVLVDDMIDTAGTIASAAALLHQEGARAVYACCTHAVFRSIPDGDLKRATFLGCVQYSHRIFRLRGVDCFESHDGDYFFDAIFSAIFRSWGYYQTADVVTPHGTHSKKVTRSKSPSGTAPPAIERLSGGLFEEVIVTNTIPVAEQNYFPQLTVLSVANLLGETIWRVHDDGSVSSIFQ